MKILLVIMFLFLFCGCYTVSTTDDSIYHGCYPAYNYMYMYGQYYPYWYHPHFYPYVPPVHKHYYNYLPTGHEFQTLKQSQIKFFPRTSGNTRIQEKHR